jgi:hypothetical protein
MKKSLIIPLLLFLCSISVLKGWGQNGMMFQDQFQVPVKKAISDIKIDGILDESSWNEAGEAKDFFMKWPNDEGRPKRKTFVKVTYDQQFIYFGIKAMDTSFYIAQTLKASTKVMPFPLL